MVSSKYPSWDRLTPSKKEERLFFLRTQEEDIRRLIEELQTREMDRIASTSIQSYLKTIRIDCRPDALKLTDAWERDPWQQELYAILAPMIARACGYDVPPGPQFAFITLPRGHSKTSTMAQLISWGLAYARRPITAYAAAADKDQAKILLQRIEAEKKVNPWLDRKLKRTDYHVTGPMGKLEVLSSDAPSSSGLLADIYLLDELVWWQSPDLFNMLLSGIEKRPNAVFIILSNAGVTGTWQHSVWEGAASDPDWVRYEIDGIKASWINKERIARRRKLLPVALAARLFDNQWQSETGEFLTRDQLVACVDPELREATGGRYNGLEYIFSTDYGATKDRATAAVTHVDPNTDLVILDKMWIHQGAPGTPTPIDLVMGWADVAVRDFNIVEAVLDPYQLEILAQRLETQIESVRRFQFASTSAKNGHHALASNLRSLVINRRFRMPPHVAVLTLPDGRTEDLVDELSQLVVEVMRGKAKYLEAANDPDNLDSVDDQDGVLYRANHKPGLHDDRYTSLSLSVLAAVQRLRKMDPFVIAVNRSRGKVEIAGLPENENYASVAYLKPYECWAAMVMRADGSSHVVRELRTSHEAGWVVNKYAADRGEPAPNVVPDVAISDERLVELAAWVEQYRS